MIVFDLCCPESHVFEGWFRDSAAYEAQTAAGDLSCPICGSHDIAKALMAPNIPAKGNAKDERRALAQMQPEDSEGEILSETMASTPALSPGEGPSPELFAAAMKALRALHKDIEKNCDYVGENFAEEARKIHYGETDPRGIYGEATPDEARELREEGVEVMALPRPPQEDA
jgi:hypothetical protein